MWKCSHCGGEIIKSVYGRFEGEERGLDKYGSSWDTNVTDLEVAGGEYFCEDCGCDATDINDIAYWVGEEDK